MGIVWSGYEEEGEKKGDEIHCRFQHTPSCEALNSFSSNTTRPILSQLWSFKIRGTTFLYHINLANLLIMKHWNCESRPGNSFECYFLARVSVRPYIWLSVREKKIRRSNWLSSSPGGNYVIAALTPELPPNTWLTRPNISHFQDPENVDQSVIVANSWTCRVPRFVCYDVL